MNPLFAETSVLVETFGQTLAGLVGVVIAVIALLVVAAWVIFPLLVYAQMKRASQQLAALKLSVDIAAAHTRRGAEATERILQIWTPHVTYSVPAQQLPVVAEEVAV